MAFRFTMATFVFVAASIFFATNMVAQSNADESEPIIKTEIDTKSEEVIADYVEAMGGAMRVLSIESAKLVGEYGTEGSMHEFTLLASGTNCHLVYNGGERHTFCNRLHQWNVIEEGEPSVNSSIHYSETFPVISVVAKWGEFPGKISFQGVESYDGTDVNVLLFQSPGRNPMKRYFDLSSGLMVAQHANKYFQKFEYSDLEDLKVLSRQTLLNSELNIHQIIEYETTVDVEFDAKLFVSPEEVKDVLDEKLEELLNAGLIEPAEDTLRIGKGD